MRLARTLNPARPTTAKRPRRRRRRHDSPIVAGIARGGAKSSLQIGLTRLYYPPGTARDNPAKEMSLNLWRGVSLSLSPIWGNWRKVARRRKEEKRKHLRQQLGRKNLRLRMQRTSLRENGLGLDRQEGRKQFYGGRKWVWVCFHSMSEFELESRTRVPHTASKVFVCLLARNFIIFRE